MTWLRLCRLSPGVITFHYVTLIAPGAFVVTVDVDVVVVVDVVCGSGRKTWCLGPQISRVVAPQKYNQLIWLSSRQLILYTCDEMTVEQTCYGKSQATRVPAGAHKSALQLPPGSAS